MSTSTSSTPGFEEIDSLSLLAHKVAPRVYDLSSRQINVSIRDQMVRAQQLVRDLRKADAKAESLLIVGMGAAGMTAALSACEAGFKQVCVVDTASEPFSLFKGVHSRFVGPFMYEWPSPFHGDQSYPSHEATPWSSHGACPLQWAASEPISADELGKALRKSLLAWLRKRNKAKASLPLMRVGVKREAITGYVSAYADHERAGWDVHGGLPGWPRLSKNFGPGWGHVWPRLPAGTASPANVQPDHIILAAGMGVETTSWEKGKEGTTPWFWANDRLKDAAVADQCVVVLGGADGAMQDALRSVTIFDHPLSFIRHLEAKPIVRHLLEAELPALLSADRQMRQHNSWSSDPVGFAMVDAACLAAAKRLAQSQAVRAQVLGGLRQGLGEVLLLVRGSHFDKAYLLNRFVVYLLSQCVKPGAKRPANDGGMGFELVFGATVAGFAPSAPGASSGRLSVQIKGKGKGKGKGKAHRDINAHHIVVRFGIDADSIPGLQMIQLTDPSLPGANSRQRTTLSRVELPFVAMRGA